MTKYRVFVASATEGDTWHGLGDFEAGNAASAIAKAAQTLNPTDEPFMAVPARSCTVYKAEPVERPQIKVTAV